jgi:hypothetical protein
VFTFIIKAAIISILKLGGTQKTRYDLLMFTTPVRHTMPCNCIFTSVFIAIVFALLIKAAGISFIRQCGTQKVSFDTHVISMGIQGHVIVFLHQFSELKPHS